MFSLIDYIDRVLVNHEIDVFLFKDICVYIVLTYIVVWIIKYVRFINQVKTDFPINDCVKFHNKDLKEGITVQQFIKKNDIKEFQNNYWCIFNPFLWNRHFQTMFAGIRTFRFSDKVYFARHLFKVSDGGTVGLDKVVPYEQFKKHQDQKPPIGQPDFIDRFSRYMTADEISGLKSSDTKPIMLFLPGLSGSSGESYIRSFFYQLQKNNLFDCFVLNARGCGNVNLTSPSLFCALWTQDVREVVNFFRLAYPNRKIYCVGVSMGSIILNNYLCQEGPDSHVTMGILVASVWDLVTSSIALETNFISQLFYSTVMAFPLMKLLFKHKDKLMESELFGKLYTKENNEKVKRLKLFDDLFTSQFFGFTCASHYYSSASPLNRMVNLRTPIINISSMDDPITNGVEPHIMDRAKHQPFINMINTTLGGHVGFFTWNNQRWYSKPLTKFLEAFHIEVVSKEGFEMTYDEAYLPSNPLVNDRL